MIYLKFKSVDGIENKILIRKEIIEDYEIGLNYTQISFSNANTQIKQKELLKWAFKCENSRIINLQDVIAYLKSTNKPQNTNFEKQNLSIKIDKKEPDKEFQSKIEFD